MSPLFSKNNNFTKMNITPQSNFFWTKFVFFPKISKNYILIWGKTNRQSWLFFHLILDENILIYTKKRKCALGNLDWNF